MTTAHRAHFHLGAGQMDEVVVFLIVCSLGVSLSNPQYAVLALMTLAKGT